MIKKLTTELVKEVKKLQVYLGIKKEESLKKELNFIAKLSGTILSNSDLDIFYEIQELLLADLNSENLEEEATANKYLQSCNKILDLLDPSSDFNFFLKDNPKVTYEAWLEEMQY